MIDLDSHLREEYFMHEVYKLDGPFACVGNLVRGQEDRLLPVAMAPAAHPRPSRPHPGLARARD